ncbi:MAG: thiamine pyrophosphate-dependent enzyme [Gammaproteobacteria bacterium]
MTHRPSLHLPADPARPGEAPDFSYLDISHAGALARPHPSVPFAMTQPLATGLIRVLDEDQRAAGEWNPHLTPETLREGLRWMLLTRLFDERMHRSHRQGKISFYVRCLGEEAVSIAAGMALQPTDMLFPSYRNQGLFIVRGRPLSDLMCQVLTNTRDMCKGRQLPIFYHWAERNLFSLSGNLATQFPQAVGWAMAAALKAEANVAAAWTGEGSTAEGDFHQALVFAAVYRAPVVLNVVNNQWAISTFQGFAGGELQTFAARGLGYGVAGLRVDGNDFLAVHAATSWARERALAGAGATLIELVTYRAGAHSTSDDPQRYRPAGDYARWPLGDPVERLKAHLIGLREWSPERHDALTRQLEEHIAQHWNEAVQFGALDDGPRLDPALMFEDVYERMPEHLRRQLEQQRAEKT